MSNNPYIYDRIIIVPLKGKTVVVSEESSRVTIEGTDLLQGYAMKGAWRIETEDSMCPGEWNWFNTWHGPTDKADITSKQIDRLSQAMKQGSRYAVLAPRQDGLHLFLQLQGVCTSDLINREVQFCGGSPYPFVRFDGKVEVIGTMDDLLPIAKPCRRKRNGKKHLKQTNRQRVMEQEEMNTGMKPTSAWLFDQGMLQEAKVPSGKKAAYLIRRWQDLTDASIGDAKKWMAILDREPSEENREARSMLERYVSHATDHTNRLNGIVEEYLRNNNNH